ncbi:IS630 family transposase [Nostoc sp. C057]|uniref:IS630 family transposase n=1 Tax=Nostoc sp. C057 TaxID=2576903 RepID=UPI0015C3E0B0|nr:IS630 family transposase [Nostoc sp. C057]QLE48029.1 IS630 family transposase [Nostoc sp. C057]
MILNCLEEHLAPGKCVRYLCQDETRVGLKTLTGKVITAFGVKPTVKVIWLRENFWIYGAIEPLTGDHFLYEYPKLDGECFQQFLDWLSVQLGSDYAILQIDQAPAHTSSKLRWPENIIPLFQPPSAPELNPIERLWQLLKKPLKNQLFSSLQALRERIQEIFDQLTFEQVISVSSYNFILEALFYAASY